MKSLRAMIGRQARGLEGKCGKVTDFYFDERVWEVKHVVICTGWLPRHCFVVSPGLVSPFISAASELPVALTKDQIAHSWDISAIETISDHDRRLLHSSYGTSTAEPHPGPTGLRHGAVTSMDLEIAEAHSSAGEVADSSEYSLRSAGEVLGYAVETEEGGVGRLDDFLLGEDDWIVHSIVLDQKGYATAAPKAILPTAWIHSISWEDSTVSLKASRTTVLAAQRYDPASHGHTPT